MDSVMEYLYPDLDLVFRITSTQNWTHDICLVQSNIQKSVNPLSVSDAISSSYNTLK